MTNKEKLKQYGYEDAIVYQNPDFDSAIIGVDEISGAVVYDYQLMVEDMMKKDNITYQQAAEFIDFNTIRATPYFPDPKPIIVRKLY